MTSEYITDDIRIVSSAQAIRARPAMYLGPLPNPALGNRFVEEALCLSVDEVHRGACTEISIEVDTSGLVTVRDNGPGLPMEPDSKGRILAELMLTVLWACRSAKRSDAAKGSCCHLGLVAVNALSQWLRMRVFRGGSSWFQEYREGEAQAPFQREGDVDHTGVEISFRPDTALLGNLEFNGLALAAWLPSAGLRFESLEYRPGNKEAQTPLSLYFKGVMPCPK
jgi:DNA gyrase subunit B